MATVNPQIRSGHEAASLAKEENSSAPVFLRVAETAKHVGVGPVGPAFGERLEQAGGHGGDDVAGGDSVDADAVLAPFGSEVAGKLQDSRFGSVVGTIALES